MIRIKRAYEPASGADGKRILVERLWPRGIRKADLVLDEWRKEVAPSTELRKWYGHRLERWPAFVQRYRAELDANPDGWLPIAQAVDTGTVTLIYAARDDAQNSALVLRDYLAEKRAG